MQNKCKTVGKVRPYLNITSLEAMVPTKSVSDKGKVPEPHTCVAKNYFYCRYLLSRIKQCFNIVGVNRQHADSTNYPLSDILQSCHNLLQRFYKLANTQTQQTHFSILFHVWIPLASD